MWNPTFYSGQSTPRKQSELCYELFCVSEPEENSIWLHVGKLRWFQIYVRRQIALYPFKGLTDGQVHMGEAAQRGAATTAFTQPHLTSFQFDYTQSAPLIRRAFPPWNWQQSVRSLSASLRPFIIQLWEVGLKKCSTAEWSPLTMCSPERNHNTWNCNEMQYNLRYLHFGVIMCSKKCACPIQSCSYLLAFWKKIKKYKKITFIGRFGPTFFPYTNVCSYFGFSVLLTVKLNHSFPSCYLIRDFAPRDDPK